MIIGYIYRETPSQNQSWGVITRGVGDAKMRRHFGLGWAQHASQGFSGNSSQASGRKQRPRKAATLLEQ